MQNTELSGKETSEIIGKSTASRKKASFAMLLVTIGIVYGDIGTSPMYVMKSIIEGNGGRGSAHHPRD